MPPEPASESLPTLRGIDWLAALLAGIAGATDATGILAFGRYTAHMSGTTSQTVAHALSNMGPVALGILAILCFVAGAALCGFVAEAFSSQTMFLWFVVVPYLLNAVYWTLSYRVHPRDVARQKERTELVAAGRF